jgi:hypothetical protein
MKVLLYICFATLSDECHAGQLTAIICIVLVFANK